MATITATVLDANNAVVSNVPVTFSTTAGQLSISNGVTDATGAVVTDFSSGSMDPTNTTATITASVSGVSDRAIPIQITGSYVTISASKTSLVVGESVDLTVKAYNAGDTSISGTGASVSLSGTGNGTLTAATGTTDSTGTFTTTFTATTAGDVTVTGAALGATKSITLNVAGATGAMNITSPAVDPSVMSLGTTIAVTASVPSGTTNVTFTTSLGSWSECPGLNLCAVAVDGVTQTATATLTSAEPGTAGVQVYDTSDNTLSDTATIAVVVTDVNANSSVDLQADRTTVGIISSDVNSATLTAYVKDQPSSAPIANATVVFSLSNTVGGGEYVSPVVAFSETDGSATATFYSGTNTTGASGVLVTATVYDTSGVAVASDSIEIVINQQAGSVKISPGTKILSSTDNTAYIQPMTVQVTDSGGNAVAGQKVTLRVWPKRFSTGFWDADCKSHITADFRNEDLDKDLVKDATEDLPIHEVQAAVDVTGDGIADTMVGLGVDYDGDGYPNDGVDINGDGIDDATGSPSWGVFYIDGDGDGFDDAIIATFDLDGNLAVTDSYDDGKLTPAGADAGSVPSEVVTGTDGTAGFDLTYAKNSSIWITDEITANVQVSGTETEGSLIMRLPYQVGEQCNLSHSPFNPTPP